MKREPDESIEEQQRRLEAEGAPMCEECGDFGLIYGECPWADPLFKKAYFGQEVESCEEWLCLKALQPTKVDSPTFTVFPYPSYHSEIEASSWCIICGERVHFPDNCHLPKPSMKCNKLGN
ncbi:UNVERIFIED_CONTAM: hypothetical protein FKN15_021857 [Acipenser sinensis]